jgi:hypothetical protein
MGNGLMGILGWLSMSALKFLLWLLVLPLPRHHRLNPPRRGDCGDAAPKARYLLTHRVTHRLGILSHAASHFEDTRCGSG